MEVDADDTKVFRWCIESFLPRLVGASESLSTWFVDSWHENKERWWICIKWWSSNFADQARSGLCWVPWVHCPEQGARGSTEATYEWDGWRLWWWLWRWLRRLRGWRWLWLGTKKCIWYFWRFWKLCRRGWLRLTQDQRWAESGGDQVDWTSGYATAHRYNEERAHCRANAARNAINRLLNTQDDLGVRAATLFASVEGSYFWSYQVNYVSYCERSLVSWIIMNYCEK